MFSRNLHAHSDENTYRNTARDFLAIGFRQRRVVTTTFIMVFAAVILIALMLPRQYQSEMKILVRHERADSVVSAEREAPQQFRTEVSEEELQSEAELLKSRDLLSKVVIACDLQKHGADSFWSLRWTEPTNDGTPGTQSDEKISRAVLALEKELEVRPIKLTNLISATYRASDPRRAVLVLNTLSSLYLEKHLAMHRVPGAFDFFHQQAEEHRTALA